MLSHLSFDLAACRSKAKPTRPFLTFNLTSVHLSLTEVRHQTERPLHPPIRWSLTVLERCVRRSHPCLLAKPKVTRGLRAVPDPRQNVFLAGWLLQGRRRYANCCQHASCCLIVWLWHKSHWDYFSPIHTSKRCSLCWWNLYLSSKALQIITGSAFLTWTDLREDLQDDLVL